MMSKSKKSKMDPDALFGELRSVLQQPHISSGTRTHLWGLCVRMYKFYPEQFSTLWRPYLESYATHWKPDMVEITSANELKRAVKMMPKARFTLVLEHAFRKLISQKRGQQVRELLRSPLLGAITALRVIDHEKSQSFLTSPLLHGLTRMHLHMPRTSAIDLLIGVATSPHKNTLELIELNGTSEERDDPHDALARLAPLPQLRTLTLQDCPLYPRGLHALARSGICDNLEHLNLSNTGIHEAAIVNLDKRGTAQLKTLSLERLSHVSEDAGALCALLSSQRLSRLQVLDLSMALLTPRTSAAVLHALATTPNSQLQSLNLSCNHMDLASFRELAYATGLECLRELSLIGVKLSTEIVQLLATHPFFSRLDALHIHPSRINHEREVMLTTSTTLKPTVAQSFAQ